MVQSLMYCAEQIIIPEQFPGILKTFAKGKCFGVILFSVKIIVSLFCLAVIRTQPYDLLRWSASYFRCLAMNVPPPVKPRLELDSRFGCLTRGYLRVLLEQVIQNIYYRYYFLIFFF